MRYASTNRRLEEVEPASVRLIVTNPARRIGKEEVEVPAGSYVTLSHCWGKGSKPFCLQKGNLEDFNTKGIPVRELPRSFREAIRFARRLDPEKIKYIWIDSLCIVQDSDRQEDWEYEASQMYQVYRNSYLNISATAARNGEDGIYAYREPRHLWESEINVNGEIVGLFANQESDETFGADDDPENPTVSSGLSMRDKRRKNILGSKVQRCSVVDPAFWHLKVDDAPVNRRAWVLQERLLAPRVIHFCDDQVAWECGELDAAESAPHGISDLEHRRGIVQQRIRLKDQIFLGEGSPEQAHAKWQRIVERYSKTSLSQAKDKLIAMAGIAELMSHHIGGRYVAGLWEEYLASQLLWRVETVYQHDKFQYPGRRPKQYRAPSFSWAAIDAPQGVRCCETKKQDVLLITVENVAVEHQGTNRFGQVKEGASLEVSCQLLNIRMEKKVRPVQDDSIYTWSVEEHWMPPETTTHASVYLDSPLDDFDDARLVGPDASIQLAPAYKTAKGYVVCLLLRRDSSLRIWPLPYRRVGLTVIPPYVTRSSSVLLDEEGRLRHFDGRMQRITLL